MQGSPDHRPRPSALFVSTACSASPVLFCLRGLSEPRWNREPAAAGFLVLNIGLAMMVFMSLGPSGIYQAWASVSKGMWFARSRR